MSARPEAVVETVRIEVDGIALEVPKNSMIIEATDRAGIDIPRFCYHPKLSIAANCRMCLVEVEKAPKPLPACATPVMEGMKVYTRSRRAIDAQHGVMEFLLINHPLDCPICDQGGECELQDLAMGYGRSVSRFTERKRVVKDKNVGPLIQTDMTRCIHCTRCIRFLEEIAGTSEMGGVGRGDRLEIGTCIERSIDSELSGNIIDLCPVGALTNKPFRYSARAWELTARPSAAMHDGLGSSLYYHVRGGQVMRAVPREDEATNEAWLADRDRYSHFGLYAGDRVRVPHVRDDGEWREATWDEAMARAAGALRAVVSEHGGEALGVLMSPSAANEEYFLAQKLARALGCGNIDHRLRELDFTDDPARPCVPQFAMPIAQMEAADAVLLVGSNVRHEAPILGHRVRKAWRAGATVSAVNPLDWDFHFDLAHKLIVAPQRLVDELAAIASALASDGGAAVPDALAERVGAAQPDAVHRAIAEQLRQSDKGLVLLGHMAQGHFLASWIRQLSGWIAAASGAALNVLAHGGNSVGAWLAGAVPHRGPAGAAVAPGLNARAMLAEPRRGYLLWGFEPDFDTANPALAHSALAGAEHVVAVASFATSSIADVAEVILPLAPWPETEGSMVNVDGAWSELHPAGRLTGEARPGWKILRRLGAELGLEGFGQIDIGDVRREMPTEPQPEFKPISVAALPPPPAAAGLYRAGEVPAFSLDPLCRRADALQETAHAQSAFVALHPDDAGRLGCEQGDAVNVSQDGAMVSLPLRVSTRVPAGTAWVRSATCATRVLGDGSGPIAVEAG